MMCLAVQLIQFFLIAVPACIPSTLKEVTLYFHSTLSYVYVYTFQTVDLLQIPRFNVGRQVRNCTSRLPDAKPVEMAS